MELSKFFYKTTTLTMDALIKSTDTSIITTGLQNLPKDQPIIFVANHFTRIETFYLPYVIKSDFNNKYTISMAHYSFFGGNLGKVLSKLGAISTKDPDRDRYFLHALLTAQYNSVIFPEGQMIKDKKFIEKGKFMIYNAGFNTPFIRREPHTGAARIALQAELIREKIKYFLSTKQFDKINIYKDYFELTDEKINDLSQLTTHIVPVNISYYPIRSRNNAIKSVAEKFIKNIPGNIEEEIELEGSLLLHGVDINVNFGKPFLAKDYLFRNKKNNKLITNNKTYISKDEIKEDSPFKRIDYKLLYDFMEQIYNLVTVNYDHILSYILKTVPWNNCTELQLKNKAFLAIEDIKKLSHLNLHSSLLKNQFHLLTDDEHKHYKTFIDEAISEGLITASNGTITRHKKRFSNAINFYFIRKDNLIEILKNELEPITSLTKILKTLMKRPPFLDRRKIRKKILKLDQDLFLQDYKKYNIEGESKPKNIGAPFLLKESIRKGIILVHGYMAAPEEVRCLANYLHRTGYTVYCPRLRGHGTSPEDLAKRQWIDWYHSVNRAYIIMENYVDDIAIIGFSTGAGLALLQAAKKRDSFKGVISINAPLKLQNIKSRFSSAVMMWNNLADKIKLSKAKMEYVSNEPENPHINYFRNPVHGVNELGKLMNTVENSLELIKVPVLVIQGSEDPVVNPDSAYEIFNKLTTLKKELHMIHSTRHGILHGNEFNKVATNIKHFLKDIF